MAVNHAWVTLVMRSNSYVPGALCLAHSIRESGSIYPIICMVTPEINDVAVEALQTQFAEVVRVDTLRRPCVRMLTKKQNQNYGSWIETSFTKMHVFDPEFFGQYRSVAFLDADQIAIRNPDSIFEYGSPAGIFSDVPWCGWSQKQTKITNYFSDISYGEIVPRYKIDAALAGCGLVASCSTFVVSPNAGDYERLVEIIGSEGRYGRKTCFSGFDEQLFAEISRDPINIPGYYSYFVGKEYLGVKAGADPRTNENICILHYYGSQKPWDLYRNEAEMGTKKMRWADLAIWWDAARKVYGENHELKVWFFRESRPI